VNLLLLLLLGVVELLLGSDTSHMLLLLLLLLLLVGPWAWGTHWCRYIPTRRVDHRVDQPGRRRYHG
jgi:hypothetical protein